MPAFDLVSEFAPGGDQPAAIASLVRGIEEGKKSQVLLVLRTGGRITAGHRPGLLQLLGADDSPIPAWQTALKAAQASSAQSGDTHEPQ